MVINVFCDAATLLAQHKLASFFRMHATSTSPTPVISRNLHPRPGYHSLTHSLTHLLTHSLTHSTHNHTQVSLLCMLAATGRARRVLEVGTFTGRTLLSLAAQLRAQHTPTAAATRGG